MNLSADPKGSRRVMLLLNQREAQFVAGLAQQMSSAWRKASLQEAIREVLRKLDAQMAAEQMELQPSPRATKKPSPSKSRTK